MNQRNPHEGRFDDAAARFLDGFAQRLSRRGMLARGGKFALGLMGLSLVPNLPLDRAFVAEAQSPNCGDWRLCGMCGNLCAQGTSCCGGGTGGDLFICPGCTVRRSFWSRCCPAPDCSMRMISYFDCCGGTDVEAAGCVGELCAHDCPTGVWCGGSLTLRCTVIVVGASC